ECSRCVYPYSCSYAIFFFFFFFFSSRRRHTRFDCDWSSDVCSSDLNSSPAAAYTLNNLKLAWARTEMKLVEWDTQRDQPGPEVRSEERRVGKECRSRGWTGQ